MNPVVGEGDMGDCMLKWGTVNLGGHHVLCFFVFVLFVCFHLFFYCRLGECYFYYVNVFIYDYEDIDNKVYIFLSLIPAKIVCQSRDFAQKKIAFVVDMTKLVMNFIFCSFVTI